MSGFFSSRALRARENGPVVLGAYLAFAALPGMEFPCLKGIERFFIAAGAVQKCDIAKEKIISSSSHFRMAFHGF